MSACCDHDHAAPPAGQEGSVPPGYRRALAVALAVNAAMFVVELGAGWSAGSVSLLADAVDFFADALNYAASLAVLALALQWRSRLAWLKGWAMAAFGAFVLLRAAFEMAAGQVPEAATMGLVGILALSANVGVALLLYAYRDGDANMRAVWLCTRNDALGNLAVLGAAAGVFGTGSAWPDLLVAGFMAGLALRSSRQVLTRARQELRLRRASSG